MYALRERRVHVTQEDFELAVAKVRVNLVCLIFPTCRMGTEEAIFFTFTFLCVDPLKCFAVNVLLCVCSQLVECVSFRKEALKGNCVLVYVYCTLCTCRTSENASLVLFADHAERLREEHVDQEAVEIVPPGGCFLMFEFIAMASDSSCAWIALNYIAL